MAINLTSYQIVGDCEGLSNGAFNFSFNSNVYPIFLNWSTYPFSFTAQTGVTFYNTVNSYNLVNLPAGYYSFVLNNFGNATFPNASNNITVNFIITSSSTVFLNTTRNTTCGNNNGVLNSVIETQYLNPISINSNATVNGTTFPTSNSAITNALNKFSTVTQLYDSNGLLLTSTGVTNSQFSDLAPGIYYTITTDSCGCSSTSNSQIILPSVNLNFDLYNVNIPACKEIGGKLIVSGLTGGLPPLTYVWTGAQYDLSGSSVTGLSFGQYSLKITDSNLCSKTVTKNIGKTASLGYITFESVQPTCYSSDGTITFYFSGGAAPFFYQLSNGDSQYSLSNQVTFTGLSSGFYTCTVNDVGLCTSSASASLSTPNSFNVVSVTSSPASCNFLGSVKVDYNGGSPPYSVSLSGSNYPLNTISTSLNATTFSNLIPGTYNLNVNDTQDVCEYSTQVTVGNINHFDLITSTTGTTCGGSNGALEVSILNPYKTGLTFNYLINSVNSLSISATTYLIPNLPSGNYSITVTDSEGCTQSATTTIQSSVGPQVFLSKTNTTQGQNNGTITAYVKSTDGPFGINWSQNANGQTGIYISGLSAGTYIMTLTSSTGCQTIGASVVTSESATTTATSYNFKYTTGTTTNTPSQKFTLQNMIYSGYSGLIKINNGVNCILDNATFFISITIGGIDYDLPFYNTKTIDDIPDFSYFAEIIETSVLSVPNIQSCSVNVDSYTIDIVAKTSSNSEYYKDETISFSVSIDYVIKCNSVNNVVC